jgi:hypothetical protein
MSFTTQNHRNDNIFLQQIFKVATNTDNQETDYLDVTLLRASNLQTFRNINNNKTCSNPER